MNGILCRYIQFFHLCDQVCIYTVLDGLGSVVKQLAKLLMSAHLAIINPCPHIFPQPQELLSRGGLRRLKHVVHLVLKSPYAVLKLSLCGGKRTCLLLFDPSHQLLHLLPQPIDDRLIVIFNCLEALSENFLGDLLCLSGLVLDEVSESLLHQRNLVAVPAHGLFELRLNRGLVHSLSAFIRGKFGVHPCLNGLPDGSELLAHHVHLQLILLVLLRQREGALCQQLQVAVELHLLLVQPVDL